MWLDQKRERATGAGGRQPPPHRSRQAAKCRSRGRRHRCGDLADEVASESVDQPLKLGLLVRVPAGEELVEKRAFRGDESLVVFLLLGAVSRGGRQRPSSSQKPCL